MLSGAGGYLVGIDFLPPIFRFLLASHWNFGKKFSMTSEGQKKPVNGWRVATLIAVPLLAYSIWMYAETEAKYRHLLNHVKEMDQHSDHDH